MDLHHQSRRLVVREELFLVKFHGYQPQDGPTYWEAVTAIVQDEAGCVIAGDRLTESADHRVAGLSGSGDSPDEALLSLESKLIEMKSVEF
jgi:hypothetical protein